MNDVIKYLAKFSIFIVPIRFVNFVNKVIDYILSYRFLALIKKYGNYHALLMRPFFVRGHKYISVGTNFTSGPGLRLECWDVYENEKFVPKINIGDNVCFNYRCHVGAINEINIGNNVLIGSNVLIIDHSHGYNNDSDIEMSPAKRNLYSKGMIVIEDSVWIGEGACVLPNVRIGHNSIIGANSVVTKDIPPYSIAVGNPAKILKILKDGKC